MSKITGDMVRVFNQRLSGLGSPWRIVENDYEGAGYSQQTIASPVDPTVAPFLVDQVKYTNGTDLEQQVILRVQKDVKLTRSVAVTNNVKIGTTGTTKFSIGLVEVEATVSLEYTRDETTTDTTEETVSFAYEQPLRVPPHQIVTMQTIIQMQTVTDLPFELHVLLSNGSFGVIPKDLSPFYRYYNGVDHFYATDPNVPEGYTREGVACYIGTAQGPSMVPLYRFYNGTEHLYTRDPGEGSGEEWSAEGNAGFVYPFAETGSVPLYRYYNGTDHFYTTSATEVNPNDPNNDEHSEGIAAYVVPAVLSDPSLLRNVQQLFPNNADRLFIIPGKYHGQSTNRLMDVLLRTEPVPTGAEGLRGKQLTERTAEGELAAVPILSPQEALRGTPGQLLDLTLPMLSRT